MPSPNRSIRLLFLLLSSLFGMFFLQVGLCADVAWELVPKYSEDGIVVHQRKSTSDLLEVNGSGLIDAPITTVLNIVNDNEHRRDWMKSSLVAKIVGPFPGKPHSLIFYNGVHVPWPCDNRFFYVVLTTQCAPIQFRDKSRIQEEFFGQKRCKPLPGSPLAVPAQVSLEFTSHPTLNDPTKYPIPDGTVRVTSMHGHWYFYPMICDGREQTFAEYQVYADFAGKIPLWLVNRQALSIPYQMLKELRTYTRLHKRDYENYQKLKEQFPHVFSQCLQR